MHLRCWRSNNGLQTDESPLSVLARVYGRGPAARRSAASRSRGRGRDQCERWVGHSQLTPESLGDTDHELAREAGRAGVQQTLRRVETLRSEAHKRAERKKAQANQMLARGYDFGWNVSELIGHSDVKVTRDRHAALLTEAKVRLAAGVQPCRLTATEPRDPAAGNGRKVAGDFSMTLS